MDSTKNIFRYFPDLSQTQKNQIQRLQSLYSDWNNKINVISRKDMDFFYERHVLHSLAIAKTIMFQPGTKIMDAGTGGGFPGIPLAILFPDVSFHLVDSTGKKLKIVNDISDSLTLDNVSATRERIENVDGSFDFIISRAVAKMSVFYSWVQGKVNKTSFNNLDNGILYLKGGDLGEEMNELGKPYTTYSISDYFSEPFFKTKKLIYVALKG
jgi:16S rRNA (guanine527-N7)-methyltransferase